MLTILLELPWRVTLRLFYTSFKTGVPVEVLLRRYIEPNLDRRRDARQDT